MNLGVEYGGVLDGAQLQRVDPLTGHAVDLGPELSQVSGHALHVQSLPETTRWRQVSGTGLASFDDSARLDPLVTVDRPGTYVLALEVFSAAGALVASDTLVLTGTGWESFCAGDGSGAACPCGNDGGPGGGCANSTGLGGRLALLGGTGVAADEAVLEASQLPPGKAGLFIAGPFAKNGGLGTPFGDGLRCAKGSSATRCGRVASTE